MAVSSFGSVYLMVVAWPGFKMHLIHSNQIATSAELVRELLRSQYLDIANEPIAEQPMHGTDSDTYRVGDHHAVRLPIIDWAFGKQEHIRPWLPWINVRISTPVPIPVYYGAPDCGYPHTWTIYPWLPGETLDFGVESPDIARDIAGFLLEVRAMPIEGAPSAGRSPHALDGDVRKCLDQLTDKDGREELIKVWDEMMQSPAWDGEERVWMHGDVAPGNLLFIEGTFAGAIDWTEIGVGDPASDLQVAWNFFGPKGREAFREAMRVDDAVWDRARARAFAQASFQLPYYRDTFPALAEQAQYVFAQIFNETQQS